jgi:hypothetical protein
MLWIVHLDHHLDPRLVGSDATGIGEQLRIALGVDDGLIRRRRGQAIAVAEHRLVGAHPPIVLPRSTVGVEGAVGEVDVGNRGRHKTS